MFSDDDLIPLSALQHLLFCERQCALIHVEGLWSENPLTVEGRRLHQLAHNGATENRTGLRITRGLPLVCYRLGLIGKADVVEFHRLDELPQPSPGLAAINGLSDLPQAPSLQANEFQHEVVRLAGIPGLWRPFPIEYKRGRPKRNDCDRIQLCAQALCLEEMLRVTITSGALFYGKTRRRQDVAFNPTVRAQTEAAAVRVRFLIQRRLTPSAIREPKCERCSLINLCLPQTGRRRIAASDYLARELAAIRLQATEGAHPHETVP